MRIPANFGLFVRKSPLGILMAFSSGVILRIMEATALTIDDQVDILLHKVAVSPNLTLSLHALYGLPVMYDRKRSPEYRREQQNHHR
jgi:hypothetical protein